MSYTLIFFCDDPASAEIYTLSLHDALPILQPLDVELAADGLADLVDGRELGHALAGLGDEPRVLERSEEHTSELQSQFHLVCRLLPEKKKQQTTVSHSDAEDD